MLNRLTVLAVSLFALNAVAGGHYYLCDIFNGEASGGCGSWYQGKAVVQKSDGFYYECDIFNGEASGGCGSWYQGKAVVKKDDGHYYECEIFNGQPNGCGSWFQGKAVVYKDESPPPPPKQDKPADKPAKPVKKK
jgi:hypothetical protein